MLPIVTRASQEVIAIVPGSSRRRRWPWGPHSGGPCSGSCCPPPGSAWSPPSSWASPAWPARRHPSCSPPGATPITTGTRSVGQQDDLPLRVYQMIFQAGVNSRRDAWGCLVRPGPGGADPVPPGPAHRGHEARPKRRSPCPWRDRRRLSRGSSNGAVSGHTDPTPIPRPVRPSVTEQGADRGCRPSSATWTTPAHRHVDLGVAGGDIVGAGVVRSVVVAVRTGAGSTRRRPPRRTVPSRRPRRPHPGRPATVSRPRQPIRPPRDRPCPQLAPNPRHLAHAPVGADAVRPIPAQRYRVLVRRTRHRDLGTTTWPGPVQPEPRTGHSSQLGDGPLRVHQPDHRLRGE